MRWHYCVREFAFGLEASLCHTLLAVDCLVHSRRLANQDRGLLFPIS
jgi:hypothetical protein